MPNILEAEEQRLERTSCQLRPDQVRDLNRIAREWDRSNPNRSLVIRRAVDEFIRRYDAGEVAA